VGPGPIETNGTVADVARTSSSTAGTRATRRVDSLRLTWDRVTVPCAPDRGDFSARAHTPGAPVPLWHEPALRILRLRRRRARRQRLARQRLGLRPGGTRRTVRPRRPLRRGRRGWRRRIRPLPARTDARPVRADARLDGLRDVRLGQLRTRQLPAR